MRSVVGAWPMCAPPPRLLRSAAGHQANVRPPPLVLGIETSCDDTAAAVLCGPRILSERLRPQWALLAEHRGVKPDAARAAHVEHLDAVATAALSDAGVEWAQLDAIAVTEGPGIAPCLFAGINYCKQRATQHGLPLIPVHHMLAHALVARQVSTDLSDRKPAFPYLALLLSGGHSQLLLVRGSSAGDVSELGGSLDDALGEAFDKTALALGVSLDGAQQHAGAMLEELAEQAPEPATWPALSVPLRHHSRHRHSCDFSFSGLKSNVRRAADGVRAGLSLSPAAPLPPAAAAPLAAAFQHAAFSHVLDRLDNAFAQCGAAGTRVSALVVAGGCARNRRLRARLHSACALRAVELVLPEPRLCTDNGVMIAWAACEQLADGTADLAALRRGAHIQNLVARPRWPFERKQ